MQKEHNAKLLIGWKEWCSLPNLHIPAIKAKIDTGAKTSSLHAYNIEPFQHEGKHWVRFSLHPIQKNNKISIRRSAPIFDQRYVTSSSGHKELRYVIKTIIKLGKRLWEIELTLANREKMMFRMLLGRDALKGKAIIDPIGAHKQKKLKNKMQKLLYTR
ncbi:MAG: ribosomal protein S6 modification protein [Gammaproteobacteria bacterium RIFCSPHIGHO2_12_FULL_35_23]|nr:MAG: ribosomal protein S6 modification protein [Gammaproteobacteria bacterium RIFCSPHIGHO2_12_FULL_35_23]